MKKNNYYDKLPIIFINSDYYKGILHFLQQSQKYENFKNKNSLTKLLIESGEKNNNNNNHFKDKRIIADVVEKSNFYSLNDTIEIIKNIKSEIKGNYKQIINNWITTIFEILSEFFLFVLNIRLCYDKCSLCNSPILYISDMNENKKEIKKHNKAEKKDIILFKKSLINCNNIFKVISQNFKANTIKDLKNYYLKNYFDNSKKPNIPANPPKKVINKFINIIYHDENHNTEEYSDSINEDAIEFRKYTNGTFIFSDSEDSFKIIIKGIKKEKEEDIKKKDIKFTLITTGSTFEKI